MTEEQTIARNKGIYHSSQPYPYGYLIYYTLHVLAFYSHHHARQITKHFEEGMSATVIFNDRIRSYSLHWN
jgi:hypothetical protein